MALLKFKDIKKMDSKQTEERIKALEFELIRAGVTANKASAKTKEIKRAIARLKTYVLNKSNEEELKTKK